MTALSAIPDVSVRDWVDREAITPAKMAADPRKLRDAINTILTYLRERQVLFASGTAPTDKGNGKLWYDAANALLKLRRSGAWEQVLTVATAPDADIVAGGGTATGRMVIPVNVDDTDNTVNDPGPGDLTSYTVPANTLDANGVFLHAMSFGTDSGAGNAAFVLDTQLGGVSIASVGTLTASNFTDGAGWMVETFIARTSAGAQKACSVLFGYTDSGNDTVKVGIGTGIVDETSDQALVIEATGSGADDSLTQTMQIVERRG